MNYEKEDDWIMRMPEWKRRKFLQEAGELENLSRKSEDQALRNVLLSRAASLKRVASGNVND